MNRFGPLRTHLLTLLADLGEDDWARRTAAPRRSVKDVAAHLLGGDISILSGKRDGFRPPQIDNDDLIGSLHKRVLRSGHVLLIISGPEAFRATDQSR